MHEKTITKPTHKKLKEKATVRWSPIEEFKGFYEISTTGEIRSLTRVVFIKGNGRLIEGTHIATRVDRAGYQTVRLSKDGRTYTRYIHRLISETYIENPFNKPIVNHINGNKLDNRVENLEWVTHSENIKHAYLNKLIDKSKLNCKHVIDRCTGRRFKSIKEAAKYINTPYKTVVNYLNGNRRNPTCLEVLE